MQQDSIQKNKQASKQAGKQKEYIPLGLGAF
jgi:hypothetical protein